jgi:hypothetical protein
MGQTPEGKVKAKVREILDAFEGIGMYQYWPVPSGFGKTTLDVIGCFRGQFFTIETKARGKKPTPRQMEEINAIETAMGKSFIIAGEDSPVLEELRAWIGKIIISVPYAPNLTPDPVRRSTI